jgi:hypothetical protein
MLSFSLLFPAVTSYCRVPFCSRLSALSIDVIINRLLDNLPIRADQAYFYSMSLFPFLPGKIFGGENGCRLIRMWRGMPTTVERTPVAAITDHLE